jgi:uroporphyrin-3 C-methyltransferase
LITLLAVGISLFYGYQYWSGMKQNLQRLDSSLAQAGRDQAMMRERLRETQTAFQQQQQKIALQEQSLAEQRTALEKERERLRQQGVQINRSLSVMQQRLGVDSSQWQVAEAEYLLRVANHRLTLMQDPTTALAALEAADERLRATGNPGWDGVRKLLAQEMVLLRALPRVDRTGVTASLAALADQADQIPLKEQGVKLQVPSVEDGPQEEAVSAPQGFTLQRIWRDLWEGFKSMLVIRHHQAPVSAMLPPEQGYFLRQNLRLKLEGASIALMGRNASFFRESLQGAELWLERYFAIGTPEVTAFRARLAALAALDIAPEMPDISASLRALQTQREAMNREVGEE